MKKLTTEDFIKKAKEIHSDKYDYSLICPIHGVFEQQPNAHLNYKGCFKCGIDKRRTKQLKDKDYFINKSKNFHIDKYDYSLVEYVDQTTKVKIICPIHGIFEQTPKQHYKHGCHYCSSSKNGQYNKIDRETFIKISKEIHNNFYDYSLIKDINKKVDIICPIHGVFHTNSYRHMKGSICIKCKNDNRKSINYVEKFNKIHNNKYDYSLSKYINNKTKIKIICPIHGIFEQRPDSHIQGKGCPKCKNSLINLTLYIIRDDINKIIKIGVSQNPKNRLKRLKYTQKNNSLYISDIFENYSNYENTIHEIFHKFNIERPIKRDGYTEWFDNEIYDDVLNYIKGL